MATERGRVDRGDGDGTFTPGNTRGFLSNDGVDLSPFHDFDAHRVSDETKAEVEQLRADIIAGTQSVDGS